MHNTINRANIVCLTIALGMTCLCSFAQDTVINFEQGLSWKEVQAKARAENKYIFMDCYTTWCGPCKWMRKNIFNQKEVRDYYDLHFICVAVQMDQTGKDSREIKDWYPNAVSIAKNYSIFEYPTYLFFAPDGRPVHRAIGRTKNKEEFISYGEDALDPERQFYTTIRNWEQHKGDSVFMVRALHNSLAIGDSLDANVIAIEYLKTQREIYTKENIGLVIQLNQINNSSKSLWFKFLEDNVAKISTTMHDTLWVQRELSNIIGNEEIGYFFKERLFPVNWNIISDNIRRKYPMLGGGLMKFMGDQFKNYVILDIRALCNGDSSNKDYWNKIQKQVSEKVRGLDLSLILLEQGAKYYAHRKLWTKCANASYVILKKYGSEIGGFDANNIAWEYIFEHCGDKIILTEALRCMKFYIDQNPGDPYMDASIDTYANLLYKIGKVNDAKIWEKKAIELGLKDKSFPEAVIEFETTLNKMENRIATWERN